MKSGQPSASPGRGRLHGASCTAGLGRLGMRSFLGSVAESLGISKKKHSAPPARTPGVAFPQGARMSPEAPPHLR